MFSCNSKDTIIKQIEVDEYENYIIYKWNYKKDGEEYGKHNDDYVNFHLVTDYGIRIDGDKNWNLRYIYLLDKKNKIEYIIKSIDDFEYIIVNNIPLGIDINYYAFFHGKSIRNEEEVLSIINNILERNQIKFNYNVRYPLWNEDGNYFDDYKLYRIIMNNCFH
jgi:hypothetical protein